MTLEQAYDIQRKELLSLRRENARLKKGTYTDKEKQEHLALIRHLNFQVRCLTRDKDRYHELWRNALKMTSHDIEDLIMIEDLKNENQDLREQISSLLSSLQESQEIIAKLKAQMNRDHENSSIPSSQKQFHKKIKNSRQKTGRRPGGQNGHAGHRRPHMEPTVPVVHLTPDPFILADPDYYPTGKFIIKQVVDLDVKVTVTEYRSEIFRSHSTGKRYHAPFPPEAVNDFNYGPKTKALAFLLNNYCNVSIDKTSELIKGISNDKIRLSKGLINSLPGHFSDATKKERDRIYSMLLKAPSMHSDFTPGRVNGKNVQVILCANQYEMLYFLRKHKGHKGIKGTPVEEYQQILVHDHDMTYYHYGSNHQECLSHVLRYLQDSIDNETDLTWNTKMKDFLSSTIHQVKQNRNLSPEEISLIETEYDRILDLAYKEYQLHPPRRYYPEGYNLYERLRKYKKNHLLFLHHPEIEYTNNLAERALRKVKRKMKQAVTFRSINSIEDFCDCIGIIETEKLRGGNLFEVSINAFA